MRPDARARHARSSPSAPQSPPTRYPSGRSRSAAVAVALAVSALLQGCVTRHGTGYWAWNDPGFWSESRCTPDPDGAALLRIRVADSTGSALPGASIRVSRSASQASEVLTDVEGEAQVAVSPGHWHVAVELLGFRSAHYDLEVPSGTHCRVTFELDLAGSDVTTVA